MGAELTRPTRLSAADSARWHMATPENPMVIGALLLFDQQITLEELEELVRQELLPHGRFHQHVVEAPHRFGRPVWRDDSPFDLRAHVQILSLPGPLDALSLPGLVGERMSTPLPGDRSPWSFELVPLGHAGSAVLVRIHHCIADGNALISLLGELSDDERNAGEGKERARAPSRPARRRRRFGQPAGLLRFLTLPRDAASSLRGALSGQKRVAWSTSIPLDLVKSIARIRGHHLTDVLLAAVAGAVDRYERDRGHSPRQIRALLPVALPPCSLVGELGNHYASVFVRLPIAVADQQARLDAIARDRAVLGRRGDSRIIGRLIGLAGALAPSLERWAVRWWSRRASLVASSLAGPLRPLRVAGHPLRGLVVWAPAPATVALSFTFFGYAGTLHVGTIADVAVIDRPHELVGAFQAALDDLGRGAARNTR
jgi:diacylglycerol O-acyltransferase